MNTFNAGKINGELELEKNRLESEKNILRKEVNGYNVQKAELEKKIRNLEKKDIDLTTKTDDTSMKLNDIKESIKKESLEIGKLKKTNKATQKNLDIKNNAILGKILDNDSILTSKRREVEHINQSIESKNLVIDNLESEIFSKKIELSGIDAEINQFSKKKTELGREMVLLEKNLEKKIFDTNKIVAKKLQNIHEKEEEFSIKRVYLDDKEKKLREFKAEYEKKYGEKLGRTDYKLKHINLN